VTTMRLPRATASLPATSVSLSGIWRLFCIRGFIPQTHYTM
jgi:hypothetical protein